jgi:hypothetical protein
MRKTSRGEIRWVIRIEIDHLEFGPMRMVMKLITTGEGRIRVLVRTRMKRRTRGAIQLESSVRPIVGLVRMKAR